MNYGRFIDKVRIETVLHEKDLFKRFIKQRIYPRIQARASLGKNRVVFWYDIHRNTIDTWVAHNWVEIKEALEAEGFTCQEYKELGEYHIMC